MGRRRKGSYQETRKGGKFAIGSDIDTDIDECTSTSAQLGSKSLNKFLEQLYEKRGSTREAALSSIVQSYSLGYQYQFSEKNFSELLYQCLKSLKRGSAKESYLAVEALGGLLAITIGCGENGRELYRESFPVLSEALNTESQPWKLKLEAQSAAIFSWSLLLSTMDSWSLSYKHWRGAVPFFKNLLESDHESILIGARQALALILELGCLEKFEGDASAMEEMDENELLHDVFNFKPEKRKPGRELYVAERDEVAINLFVPDVRREDSFQRIHKSQNSIFVKARTQIRNKNRDIRGEELWCSGD
ncbi:Armadillo-type fold [Cynara cardunculus var. scolymus]|uniref:Armadillo-type fold n=1 Tax=Cynara cardunculus var. scolymus TaxID=59895 RepID=A0A124SD37_CYNCS|nr:Armadillo-type fold [Cynara cardunculus var. scolymus]